MQSFECIAQVLHNPLEICKDLPHFRSHGAALTECAPCETHMNRTCGVNTKRRPFAGMHMP